MIGSDQLVMGILDATYRYQNYREFRAIIWMMLYRQNTLVHSEVQGIWDRNVGIDLPAPTSHVTLKKNLACIVVCVAFEPEPLSGSGLFAWGLFSSAPLAKIQGLTHPKPKTLNPKPLRFIQGVAFQGKW